jgi:hypothetical protein
LISLWIWTDSRKNVNNVCLYLDETQIKQIFKNQISSLIITIGYNENDRFKEDSLTTICTHILTVFLNLRYLKFSDFSSNMIYKRFSPQLPSFSSSSLMELHINIISAILTIVFIYLMVVSINFVDFMLTLLLRFSRMPQLNTFSFNILSRIYLRNQTFYQQTKIFNIHLLILETIKLTVVQIIFLRKDMDNVISIHIRIQWNITMI